MGGCYSLPVEEVKVIKCPYCNCNIKATEEMVVGRISSCKSITSSTASSYKDFNRKDTRDDSIRR
jgi:hypothetical protein